MGARLADFPFRSVSFSLEPRHERGRSIEEYRMCNVRFITRSSHCCTLTMLCLFIIIILYRAGIITHAV